MKKILIFVIIPLIICIAIIGFFLYNIFGNNIVVLENINDKEKQEIITLMNLEAQFSNIKLEKMEIPRTYKDIYYKIYFDVNKDENISNTQTKLNNIYADFERISNNKYSCTISNMGKNIDILEQICVKYK